MCVGVSVNVYLGQTPLQEIRSPGKMMSPCVKANHQMYTETCTVEQGVAVSQLIWEEVWPRCGQTNENNIISKVIIKLNVHVCLQYVKISLGLPWSGHFMMSHLFTVSHLSGGIIFLLTNSNRPPEHYRTQRGNCNIRWVVSNLVSDKTNKTGSLLPKPKIYNQSQANC